MATKTKTKLKTKKKVKPESSAKKSKKQRRLEREAKRKARKGDGSFPDVLVVTKEKDKTGSKYFLGHGPDLATLYKDGDTVAVYKLRRVSTITINRKVAR